MIALDHQHSAAAPDAGLILLAPFALALLLYFGGVVAEHRRGRTWPWHRGVLWGFGIVVAGAAFAGPLSALAHQSFTGHAAGHVAVGMVAPLLLVLAAPFTLALRTLDAAPARRLSRLLRSYPARFFTHPIVAAGLNVGGMWLLYLSPLYGLMLRNPLVQWLVMVHFLVSGFLYTAALIPVDPAPHRSGYRLRVIVLMLSLAAHGILAKVLYANPPVDVTAADARSGSMLMYYAGDAVQLVIIVVLCAQWYRDAGRRLPAAVGRSSVNEAAGG